MNRFDIDSLIYLACDQDIINEHKAQKFLDLLLKNPSKKSFVIFEIFQTMYLSPYLQNINIDENRRAKLEVSMSKSFYALSMLASNGEFK
jgi:hypothetical protein